MFKLTSLYILDIRLAHGYFGSFKCSHVKEQLDGLKSPEDFFIPTVKNYFHGNV